MRLVAIAYPRVLGNGTDDIASIDVTNDDGSILGSLRRADIVAPLAALPLEIATAVDFLKGGGARVSHR